MYKATLDLNDVLLVWQMVRQVVTAHQFNPPLVEDSGVALFVQPEETKMLYALE